MNLIDKNFKEIFSSQLISIFGGLVAGSLLAWYADKLFLLPGILVMLPGFLEMRGNISGTFAARLSSGLFLGVIKPTLLKTRIIRGNLLASFLEVLIVSSALGLLAFFFTYAVSGVVIWKIFFLPIIAGFIANLIEIPLTLFMTFYLFRRNHDPNNIMGPFLTSTGDITSILALLLVVMVI